MLTSPFTMVIAVDLSEYADSVIQHGFDQAVRHDDPIVHVLTVIPDGRDEDLARGRLLALIQRTLEDAVPEDRRRRWAVVAHVRHGHADEEIVEFAEEALASLLVVGRFGAAHRKHGSTADPIVASAGCPVLVVPPPRDTSASDAQCPDCVEVRQRSRGEQWFCEPHHGDHLGHAIYSVSSTTGAPRW